MSTKVGTIPWIISNDVPKNTLIFGVDVYHERGKESCVSMISNYGEYLQNYYSNFEF